LRAYDRQYVRSLTLHHHEILSQVRQPPIRRLHADVGVSSIREGLHRRSQRDDEHCVPFGETLDVLDDLIYTLGLDVLHHITAEHEFRRLWLFVFPGYGGVVLVIVNPRNIWERPINRLLEKT